MEVVRLDLYKLAKELHSLREIVGSSKKVSFKEVLRDIEDNEQDYSAHLEIIRQAPNRKAKSLRRR